ncbi:hypothetical protein GW17_00023432 [Ensete ventricosum]|nr:hypothetical protein GW17_00023432 [Ensete ventricosum]
MGLLCASQTQRGPPHQHQRHRMPHSDKLHHHLPRLRHEEGQGLWILTSSASFVLLRACKCRLSYVGVGVELQIFTLQVFVALNLVTFIGILFLTLLLFSGTNRLTVLGWICVGFSISVYAAPMSTIVRTALAPTVVFFVLILGINSCAEACCAHEERGVYAGERLGVPHVERSHMARLRCVHQGRIHLGNHHNHLSGHGTQCCIVVYVIYRRKENAPEPAEPEHIVEVAEPAPAQAAEAQVTAEGSDNEDGDGGAQEPAAAAEHITKIAEHVAQIAEHIVKLAEMTPMSPTQEERNAAAEEGERSAVEPVVPANVINIPATEMNGRDE